MLRVPLLRCMHHMMATSCGLLCMEGELTLAPLVFRRHVSRVPASSAAAAAHIPAVARIPEQWTVTLEHPVTTPKQLDRKLAAAVAFAAEVHPDLPIATTWQGLMKAFKEGRVSGAAVASAAAAAADLPVQQDPQQQQQQQSPGPAGQPRMRVTTVGVQLRNEQECIARVCAAAGVTPQGQPLGAPAAATADALLILSGSHPVRQIPYMDRLLYNSVGLLRATTTLKQQGVLAPDLQLWAVANPVLEPDASLAAAKVEAGAQVLLTQPPLDWPAFERWMEDAHRRGVTQQARLLVGFPCLTGSGNVKFWGALCGATGNQQIHQLAEQFADAERRKATAAAAAAGANSGTPRYMAMAWDWNAQLLQQLLEVPGVAGLHVMPLTAGAKHIALDLLAQQPALAPQPAQR